MGRQRRTTCGVPPGRTGYREIAVIDQGGDDVVRGILFVDEETAHPPHRRTGERLVARATTRVAGVLNLIVALHPAHRTLAGLMQFVVR
jgi:hypothetical protein